MPGPGYSYLGDEERAGVEDVLRSWDLTRFSYDKPDWTSYVDQFEADAAALFGAGHAIAVNSGTSALITALAALGIGPGDEVIVPGYTFVASIGAVVHSGATPVLAEIDESLTLDPADVEARITDRTKAIMPVHMLGAPCDLTALHAIARRHGLALIEDVAQACGASYQGRRLGTFGELGAFSLNPFKVITSGEGGLVLTGDPKLYQRAYSFQDQGWFPGRTDRGEGDVMFGINLRMAELAGAVACAQLAKLDDVLTAVRGVKAELVAGVPDRDGVRRRVLHDPAGECGTLLVYVFDRAQDAAAAAASLGTKVLRDSGRHNYANMPQLATLNDDKHDYRPGSLPRTDDVLARSVGVSIGVSDRYLGAGFGVTVRSQTPEIERTAAQVRATWDAVLG